MENELDWYEKNPSIVVPPVDPIAVYTNNEGSIVICQKNGIQEDDHYIIIPLKFAQDVIDAIKKELQDS